MIVYICDICGAECEGRGYLGLHERVKFEIKQTTINDGTVYLDFCPECEKALAEWLKEEKEKHKHAVHNSDDRPTNKPRR